MPVKFQKDRTNPSGQRYVLEIFGCTCILILTCARLPFFLATRLSVRVSLRIVNATSTSHAPPQYGPSRQYGHPLRPYVVLVLKKSQFCWYNGTCFKRFPKIFIFFIPFLYCFQIVFKGFQLFSY